MTLTEKVAAYFRAHPNRWINAQVELEPLAGYGGWRSRVSECRTALKMNIEKPRVITVTREDGRRSRQSFYRYVPEPGFAWDQEHTA